MRQNVNGSGPEGRVGESELWKPDHLDHRPGARTPYLEASSGHLFALAFAVTAPPKGKKQKIKPWGDRCLALFSLQWQSQRSLERQQFGHSCLKKRDCTASSGRNPSVSNKLPPNLGA